jgi:hypothetical protein
MTPVISYEKEQDMSKNRNQQTGVRIKNESGALEKVSNVKDQLAVVIAALRYQYRCSGLTDEEKGSLSIIENSWRTLHDMLFLPPDNPDDLADPDGIPY